MIVQADASHIEAAWSIVDRCRNALIERGIRQWNYTYPTREDVARDVSAGQLFVLLSDSEPSAVVTLDDVQPTEYATVVWETVEPALVVHRLCVDPSAQGKGLGGELMLYVESHARLHNYASVRLDSYTGNPQSVALYRRRGYREAGQVFFPGRPLPFYCFELDVRGLPERT